MDGTPGRAPSLRRLSPSNPPSSSRNSSTPPDPQAHASTIVELPNGQLAVADGVSPDGTRYPTWNPVLFQPAGQPLHLFYKVGPSPSDVVVDPKRLK